MKQSEGKMREKIGEIKHHASSLLLRLVDHFKY
jgi:hypothetical protein